MGSRYIPPTRAPQASSYSPSIASYSDNNRHENINNRNFRENHNHDSEAAEDHHQQHQQQQRSGNGQQEAHYEGGHRNVQFSPDGARSTYQERNQGGSDTPYPEDSQLSLLRPGSSEMSIIYNSEGFPVRIIKNNQVLHTNPSDAHSIQGLSSPGSERLRNGFPMERTSQPSTRPPSAKQRAKSLPRRPVERDPFEGLEGGWWSKGEVLRNKERRELANSGKSVAGGDWSQRPETPKRQSRATWREREDDLDNVPAAGYSGHMPGLRQVGIGKSFNIAAREAKRDQALRRRANSGGRETSESMMASRNSGDHNDSYGDTLRSRRQMEYSNN